MHYDTILVPSLKTMRSSTLEILKKLSENGKLAEIAANYKLQEQIIAK